VIASTRMGSKCCGSTVDNRATIRPDDRQEQVRILHIHLLQNGRLYEILFVHLCIEIIKMNVMRVLNGILNVVKVILTMLFLLVFGGLILVINRLTTNSIPADEYVKQINKI